MTRTIVFNHPVPGSGVYPGRVPSDAVVVTPDRPGYGNAPALPGGVAPTVAGTAQLLFDQLHASGIDDIDLLIGWSGGGHYALAMAALAPERVKTVSLIATPAHDNDVPWIPDHLRPLTAALRGKPASAVDDLTEQLQGVSGDLSMLCAGEDNQLLADHPELERRLQKMLDGAFLKGPRGMASDIVAQHVTDWGFDPKEVQQPVRLIYASEDSIVSIEHGRHWAETLANATLTTIERAGHLAPLHSYLATVRP